MRWARDGYSVRSGRKKGREDPDWVKDAPPVPDNIEFYMQSYADLCSERLYEGGAIPRSHAMLYAQEHGLEPDVTSLFWSVISAMDRTEQRWVLSNSKPGEQGDGN